jgi:hypothetical protein
MHGWTEHDCRDRRRSDQSHVHSAQAHFELMPDFRFFNWKDLLHPIAPRNPHGATRNHQRIAFRSVTRTTTGLHE